jgi:hypothetical protein
MTDFYNFIAVLIRGGGKYSVLLSVFLRSVELREARGMDISKIRRK